MVVRLWLGILAALCAATAALAQAPENRRNHIAAELVVRGPALPGQTAMLALRMVPEAGWHGYWLNPGDAGLGMTLDWQVPAGAQPGTPAYPVPGTLLIAGLMNHVYDAEYAVLVPLTLPADARPGDSVPVTVDARWLACSARLSGSST